jgi:hypothetical protein
MIHSAVHDVPPIAASPESVKDDGTVLPSI